jgi:hypothetical protein
MEQYVLPARTEKESFGTPPSSSQKRLKKELFPLGF